MCGLCYVVCGVCDVNVTVCGRVECVCMFYVHGIVFVVCGMYRVCVTGRMWCSICGTYGGVWYT